MVDVISEKNMTRRMRRPRQVLVRLDEKTYDQLEGIARYNDITVSSVVRVAVAQMIRRKQK